MNLSEVNWIRIVTRLPNTAKKFNVDEKVVKVMICHFVKSKMTACSLQQKIRREKQPSKTTFSLKTNSEDICNKAESDSMFNIMQLL